MADAKKCDRCSELFTPAVGDLVIEELNKYLPPEKGDRKLARGLWQETVYDSDNPYDMCTTCSRELLAFLEPIQRPAIGRES